MGRLVDGRWTDREADDTPGGRWQRPRASIRGRIDALDPGRYHVYLAESCPWCHRVWLIITRLGLAPVISFSFVDPRPGREGWSFDPASARYRDPIAGARAVHELYSRGADRFDGRATVPILWDRETSTIVNNESSDIVRMLCTLIRSPIDLHPSERSTEIHALDARIYADLNDGVYCAGFARAQDAYDEAIDRVFATLDWLEERLEGHAFLLDRETEADWRLFPTLVRFDAAYVTAFRCDVRRLSDYPRLSAYAARLYAIEGIRETVLPELYHRGYHSIPTAVGYTRIIPRGPIVRFA